MICSSSQTGKKFDADCTSPYSLYGMTWQGRTDRTMMCQVMMWQAIVGWQLLNREVTRVRLVANGMRTRGPIHGHHVSLVVWVMVVV